MVDAKQSSNPEGVLPLSVAHEHSPGPEAGSCVACLRCALDALTQDDCAYDGDRPLPEDAEIKAAHPLRTGRHDLYQEAMRLVGARHSKHGLVELVTWLLEQRREPPTPTKYPEALRAGSTVVASAQKLRPGRLVELFVDDGCAWAIVRWHDEERDYLVDPTVLRPHVPRSASDRSKP